MLSRSQLGGRCSPTSGPPVLASQTGSSWFDRPSLGVFGNDSMSIWVMCGFATASSWLLASGHAKKEFPGNPLPQFQNPDLFVFIEPWSFPVCRTNKGSLEKHRLAS